MGTKYGSVSISGFNASPPPDDGSTGADNQIGWSKHVSKIGSPLKTGIEAINTALVTALDLSARLVFAGDNTVAGDHDRTVQIASTVTASITINLADAATMAAGYTVTVANQGATSSVIGRVTAGDTINGTAADITIGSMESITFVVNSAATGYLIKSRSGSASITSALSGDVALNNVANYFDGPVIAQGTNGTWFVTGVVTISDTAGIAAFSIKLWDGTTVISSTRADNLSATGNASVVTLSGVISNPAGNLRMSVKDASSTSGKILFNASGNSKDSSITGVRLV